MADGPFQFSGLKIETPFADLNHLGGVYLLVEKIINLPTTKNQI